MTNNKIPEFFVGDFCISNPTIEYDDGEYFIDGCKTVRLDRCYAVVDGQGRVIGVGDNQDLAEIDAWQRANRFINETMPYIQEYVMCYQESEQNVEL